MRRGLVVYSRLVHPDKGEIDVTTWPPNKPNTILNICPRGKRMVVERFGKMHCIQDAGLFFSIPFVDRINYVMDVRELALVIEPQSGVTSDNVDVAVGGALFAIVTDTEKACYNVRRPLFALTQEAMSHTESDWGVTVKRYELREIIPDQKVKEAMDKQAVAERTRRETVLTAQADREAIITRSEGDRQGDINRAEGHKASVVLAADAARTQVQQEAQAEAYRIEAEAAAKAYAISTVAKELETPEGRKAMEFLMGARYLESLVQVLPNSKMNTVFLPQDMSDVPKLMGTAMGILDGTKNKN